METTDLANPSISSTFEPTFVTFGVSDPEVLQALSEYADGPSRTHFLVTALKVGVLSLKGARGTLDGDTLRREGDRVMDDLGARLNAWRSTFEERVTGSLSRYFDPQQGVFTERVHRLTHADGELATVVRAQVSEAQATLARMFDQFAGENSQLLRLLDPTGENNMIVALRQSLDGVVQTQNDAFLSQFSLDNKAGALVRFLNELTAKHGDLNTALSRNMEAVVAEFSLDKEDSALSRLVNRVELAQKGLTAQLSLDNEDSALHRLHRMFRDHEDRVMRHNLELSAKVDNAIQLMNTRRDEAARSTRHGIEFEAALGDHLREFVQAAGDIFQDTGATTGLKPNCKVGDHVITIGPEKIAAGARIVVEAKESASYDLNSTLEEADLARRNRQADVCIFVHSTKTAQSSIPTFRRYGRDIVVKWDSDDDANDAWLQAALMVATALSTKAASHDKEDAASFDKIDKAVERIRKLLEGFDEINTCANSARSAAEKILNRSRIMFEGLAPQAQAICNEMLKIKDAAAKE